jgi:hypothetical protein
MVTNQCLDFRIDASLRDDDAATLRTVLPLAQTDERAGLLAAFYVEGYLSFSMPAVLTGLAVPMVGLTVTAYVYGTAVIVMALASMIAVGFSRR